MLASLQTIDATLITGKPLFENDDDSPIHKVQKPSNQMNAWLALGVWKMMSNEKSTGLLFYLHWHAQVGIAIREQIQTRMDVPLFS